MNRLLRALFASALLFATPVAAAEAVRHGALEISQPFTRATLPNAPVAGGFLTIENTGTEADRLVSVASPAAGAVQLHKMALEGDVMKMRQLPDGIEIAPGATVVLEPGGLHVMFLDLAQPFVEGEAVPVTLVFEKAGSVDLDLPVAAAAADAPAAGHHH